MKILLAFIAAFGVLMLALQVLGSGAAQNAFAGTGTFSPSFSPSFSPTESPAETEPACNEQVPDEGDDTDEGDNDDPEDGSDDDEADDPGVFSAQGDVSAQGDRDWAGHDEDNETDDCWGPRPTLDLCKTLALGPGVYIFEHIFYDGYCVFIGEDTDQLPSPPDNDSSSMKLVGYLAVEFCDDPFRGGSCVIYNGDDDNFVPEGHNDTYSSVYFTAFDSSATHISDADCDGDITGSDALAALRYSSGKTTGGCVGKGNGAGLAGDADCSGAVNTADAVRILLVVAGLAEPDC